MILPPKMSPQWPCSELFLRSFLKALFSDASSLKEMMISLCSHVIMLTNANFIFTRCISSLCSLLQLLFLWLLSQVTLVLSIRIIFDAMETGTWKKCHQCLWKYPHLVVFSCEMQMLQWHPCRKLSTLFNPFIFPKALDKCSTVDFSRLITFNYKRKTGNHPRSVLHVHCGVSQQVEISQQKSG